MVVRNMDQRVFRALRGNNSPCCSLYNTESLVSLIQKIYNLNLTHLTQSPTLSPPPLMFTPPRIPHIPQAYLEEWVGGLE